MHDDDRLGRLALTHDDIRMRDRMVIGLMHDRNIPLAGVLGGGYSDDPTKLADLHAILFEEAERALTR